MLNEITVIHATDIPLKAKKWS